jgi:hypothetical protein
MKKRKPRLTVAQLAAELARRNELALQQQIRESENFDFNANLALGPDHADYLDMPLPRGLGLGLWEDEIEVTE